MYNFGEIVSNVATLAQRAGDSAYLTKIKVWVNMAHRFLADIYDYYNELKDIYNFTTVDGDENYILPNYFDKPLRVYDLTNDKKLTPDTEEEYFDSNIANIADATKDKPSKYRIYGVQGITGSIGASGTIVKVKSSSASDTDSPIVRIEGYINSSKSILDFENITISTATPTAYVSGTKTFYAITHVSKSKDTTGYITVADSDEDTLAILTSVDRVLRHKIMKLGLIPDGAYSMRILHKKRIWKLVNDYDYPFIDADDWLTLEAYGYSLSEEKEGTDKAAVVWNKAKESLNIILASQGSKMGPDYQHKITSAIAQAHRV